MLTTDNLPRVISCELEGGLNEKIRPVTVTALAHGEEVFKFIVCTFAGTMHLFAARYSRGLLHAEISNAVYFWLDNLGYKLIYTGEIKPWITYVSGGGYIGIDHDAKTIKFGGYSEAFGMLRKETIEELLDPWVLEHLNGYKLAYVEHLNIDDTYSSLGQYF